MHTELGFLEGVIFTKTRQQTMKLELPYITLDCRLLQNNYMRKKENNKK